MFCSFACGHGTCLDCFHDLKNPCNRNTFYFDTTIPDADIPAPFGEAELEEITVETDFQRRLPQNLKLGNRIA